MLLVILCFTQAIWAQNEPFQKGLDAITRQALRGQLEFLASDWMQGRGTGQEGAYMAADYIASVFSIYGLVPVGEEAVVYPSRSDRMRGAKPERYTSFFQNFPLLQYDTEEAESTMEVTHVLKTGEQRMTLRNKVDYYYYGSTVNRTIKAPVVFAGYGLKDDANGYNDYGKIDADGKFVMLLAGFPGHEDTSSMAYKKFVDNTGRSSWQMSQDKVKNAESEGAVGVIMIADDIDLNFKSNVPFRNNFEFYEGEDNPYSEIYGKRLALLQDTLENDIPTVYLTRRAAIAITTGNDLSFDAFEEEVKNALKPASRLLKGITLSLSSSIPSEIIQARNVVGMIEGAKKDEVIVVGAHYDHLGKYEGLIWNGSDDNASGTVGVMTIAKAFIESGKKPERTIIFAAWSGEEKGLLGSRYFVDNPVVPVEDIVFYLNLDMISRSALEDTLGVKLHMTYTDTYPVLKELTEKHVEEHQLDLEVDFKGSPRPRGGSDHTPFAEKGIPVVFYITGLHPDYHTPFDHVEKANWDKMQDVVKLSFLNLWELANDMESLK